MALIILGFSILAVLVTGTAANLEIGNNSIYLINAEWADDTEKFRLVTRWGIK